MITDDYFWDEDSRKRMAIEIVHPDRLADYIRQIAPHVPQFTATQRADRMWIVSCPKVHRAPAAPLVA